MPSATAKTFLTYLLHVQVRRIECGMLSKCQEVLSITSILVFTDPVLSLLVLMAMAQLFPFYFPRFSRYTKYKHFVNIIFIPQDRGEL